VIFSKLRPGERLHLEQSPPRFGQSLQCVIRPVAAKEPTLAGSELSKRFDPSQAGDNRTVTPQKIYHESKMGNEPFYLDLNTHRNFATHQPAG